MKYYELEEPIIIGSDKNVIKVFHNHGKVQVFPRVLNAKHGIGRGATLDLASLNKGTLIQLQTLMNTAIEYQLQTRSFEEELN